jgi:acyl dehydratase
MRLMTTRDLVDAVGTDLGTTEWVRIDQHRIDRFAEVTEDRQWIHVDPERAKQGPFGKPIAHGYLTLSLVSKFLLELIAVTDAGSVVNYGLDRLRFPSPVPTGAQVRGHGEFVSAARIRGGTQTVIRVTVECDASNRPAAVADVVTLFLRD